MTIATRAALLISVVFVGGCNAFDGSYAPGCMAFSGDNIELTDGRFVWDRFTDAIQVDADGNPIDQFPDFPVEGTYTIEDNRVVMVNDAGDAMDAMYIHEIEGTWHLLTQQQHDAWTSDGALEPCALVREAE